MCCTCVHSFVCFRQHEPGQVSSYREGGGVAAAGSSVVDVDGKMPNPVVLLCVVLVCVVLTASVNMNLDKLQGG
jgi:hypothetical protein